MFSETEDFIRIALKDLSMEEEVRGGSFNDSVFLANSAVHNKFPNKMSNLQQLMSFKQEQEGNHKKNVCRQFSSSVYQQPTGSFDTANRHYSSVIPQKSLDFDGHGNHAFAMPLLSSPSTYSFSKVMHQSGHDTSDDAKIFPVPRNQVKNFLNGCGFGSINNLSADSWKQQQQQPQLFGGMSRVPAPASGNTNSIFSTRKNSPMCVPASAQLTVFYGGVVNVYDNVSIEKAQEVMLLASNHSSRVSSDAVNQREQNPLTPSRKVIQVNATKLNSNHQTVKKKIEVEPVRIQMHANVPSPHWPFSSPVSATSRSAVHSGNSSSSSDATKKQKKNTTLQSSVSKLHNETSKPDSSIDESSSGSTLISIAVPMARKASLARFLEKRKERVCSAAPYSTQKHVECSSSTGVVDTPTFPGKNPMERTLEITVTPHPGSEKHSWCLGSKKYRTHDKPPNTNLEI